jgi:hypothetical protein
MRCISRITEDTYCQNFGNGRNKFYVELRCELSCVNGSDVCSKCSNKSDSCKVQTSRRFNHGKVNEPIPDESHIYGGKWYMNSVKKYGEPAEDVIIFAEDYKNRAHSNITNFTDDTSSQITSSTTKRRKPRVAPDDDSVPESKTSVSSRKKNIVTPYSSLVNTTTKLVHKEVAIPTHIETKLEEISTDGFEIEYVRLTPFEAGGSTYFRDSKNKLYKKVKDKVGAYIGRWNPDTDMIITDIPDSDDES